MTPMTHSHRHSGMAAPRHRPAIIFLALFAIALLALMAGNVALGYAQFGKPTALSFSVCHGIDERAAAARALPSPKLVLIGGSGVRAGLSAAMVSAGTGIPTLNFGIHAGIGPGLILHGARRVLRPGDTAVLLFEYNHYQFDTWNNVAIDVAFDCMVDYLNHLPLKYRVAAFFAYTPKRVIDVLEFDREAEDRYVEQRLAVELARHDPDVEDAIRHGDRPLTDTAYPPVDPAVKQRLRKYQPTDIDVHEDSFGVSEIETFVAWARANDIRVLASWPNTIDFPEYDDEPGFDEIKQLYASLGVPVVGEPDLGFYPFELFYDTQYHLGLRGIRLHSRDFIAAICAAGLLEQPCPHPTQ